MEKLVVSTMLTFSKDSPLAPCSKGSPLRNTLSASGRSRAPLHTKQGSDPKKCLVPSPLHAGQAP